MFYTIILFTVSFNLINHKNVLISSKVTILHLTENIFFVYQILMEFYSNFLFNKLELNLFQLPKN